MLPAELLPLPAAVLLPLPSEVLLLPLPSEVAHPLAVPAQAMMRT